MIKKILPIIILLLFMLTGCSVVKENGLLNINNTGVNNQTVVDQNKIRPEIKASIDKLKDFHIVSIEHAMFNREFKKIFEPRSPKEFQAGMYEILFQKVTKQPPSPFEEVPRAEEKESVEFITAVCQTEQKVGHLHKVTPGITVVDGDIFIFLGSLGNLDSLNKINDKIKLTKDEQKYFIEQVYRGFSTEMPQFEADYLNSTKDYALAIYFNGNKGIDEFVSPSFCCHREAFVSAYNKALR